METCTVRCHDPECQAELELSYPTPDPPGPDGQDPRDLMGFALFRAGWSAGYGQEIADSALCPAHSPPWHTGGGHAGYHADPEPAP